MQLSARGAQKKRDESKKLSMYSKQWLPGDTLRVFYPIFWKDGRPEIAVGAVWGHSVSDIKALGLKTAFIPSTTEFDENKQPIGKPDITYQFSRIARAFVNGQKEKEIANAEDKMWPTPASKKEALKTIEEKYSKDAKSPIRPIISPVQYYITTEVVSVKIANDRPVDDSITVTSSPLSSVTVSKLYSILDDSKYCPEEGANFLEVEWKYPAKPEKAEASKAATVSGLTAAYLLCNQHPSTYRLVESACNGVMSNAESIIRRATKSINQSQVLDAITQYSFLHSDYLDFIDDADVDLLSANISIVDKLGFLPNLHTASTISKLKEALDAYKESVDSEDLVDIPNPLNANSSMPTDAASEVATIDEELDPNAPSLDALLSGNIGAESAVGDVDGLRADDSILDDIDLSSVV